MSKRIALIFGIVIRTPSTDSTKALRKRISKAGRELMRMPAASIDESNLADLAEHIEAIAQLARRARASRHNSEEG